ncbi:MAG: SDR family NAD(P)-dependent oxidoreductase [Treponema sp.]|nr:SDR family NAD(P)-dependent oxidoreductase [Treponema sp.]
MKQSSVQVDLSGKTAVITGGGRGIGKAIAEYFAEAGAAVVVAARSAGETAAAAREITGRGGEASAVEADVTVNASVEALFRETEQRYGGVDIVVINAGGSTLINNLEACEPEAWKNIIDVNLLSVFYTAHAAIPYLKKRGGGKIIVTGSGAGFQVIKKSSAYSCAKAGLHAIVKTLAEELVSGNISVNEIIPGPVNTGLFHAAQKAGDTYDPAGEWVKEPGEVARLALYLASFPDNGPSGQTFSLRRRPLF